MSLRPRPRRRLSLEPFEPRLLLAADVLITEFVASNDSTLLDQDREASDWLELFNDSPATVNLDGWSLTDDADDLVKWRLPAVDLEPGAFLVVFASGKDRAVAGSELHTNFRLATDGEFLALVKPDGSTISQAFDPYPRQFTDVSYGVRSETITTELVSEGSESRVLLPGSAAEDVATGVWTQPAFEDASWASHGVGLGFSSGRFDSLVDDVGDLSLMEGATASAYVRVPFEINDPVSSYDQLELAVNYDDGFTAYLNGAVVASRNAPLAPNWESTATAAHGGVLTSLDFDGFAAAADLNLVGAAAWAPRAVRLTGPDPLASGAAWTTEALPFGPQYSFSAFMEIDVSSPGGASDADGPGGHGMAFVLQSGGRFRLGDAGGALGLDNAGMQFVAVEFDSWSKGSFDPDDALPSHLGIDSSLHGSVARIEAPRFNDSDGSQPRYVWVEYDGVVDQFEVYFSADDVRPGTPTLTATLDLEEVFADSPTLWAGWTAANGEETWNQHEVRDFRIATTAEHALTVETIDLTEFLPELRTGENVLAIHGLNVAVDDDDFLIRPRLTATQNDFVNVDAPGYFATPTPGQPNAEPTAAPAGDVAFSVSGRTFVDAFNLVLSAETANAEIRYTTDGSIPDENSPRYTQPLRVDTSLRIRARVFEAGKAAGPVASQAYIAIGAELSDFEGGVFDSNLPLMIFHSFGGNVDGNATNLVPVSSVFINNTNGRASLLADPEFAGRAGLRIRGQSSQGWPKKQYALEIWDEGNSDTRPLAANLADDRSVSIFGLPAESDWVLNGPYSDKTQLNNYLTFRWSSAMGQYAPRARLVEVFVRTREGALDFRTDYRGTYVLLEKIKIDAQRVNIAELLPSASEEPEISGGYIWKYDKDGAGDVNFVTTFQQRAGSSRPWKYVEPERPSRPQQIWLREYLAEFETVLYGSNFADPIDGYAKYIDVDSWIDTWLLVEFTKNIDGFRLSTYYHKDRGGKIKQGPAWDYNLSLANANYLNGAFPNGWYHDSLSAGDYPYWGRLFQDPNFALRVQDRWFELRQTVFRTENLLADVDAAVAQLTDDNPLLGSPAAGQPSNPISRNFARWGTLNTYLWPNCFFGSGSCPTSPLPNRARPASYADYVFILRDFIERRAAWIDGQFVSPPDIAPASGVVDKQVEIVITPATEGEVYYTVDGSDPRDATTRRVAENAIRYEGPFVINENATVQSRVMNRRTWSAKAAQTYYVTLPNIAISELNYNPAQPTAAEIAAGFTDNDDFEFIELVNYGGDSLNLENVRFVEGVEATLINADVAPGERVVVVRNEQAFRVRHGDDARIVGQYGDAFDPVADFQLSNAGERLVMIGALGEPVFDVSYDDAWYPLTDGEGFSLVRREPFDATAENVAGAWRPSDFLGGSPGAIERGVSPDPGSVVINEVVARRGGLASDVIELRNRTERDVSVAGFYVSDDAQNPTKYRLPADVRIPAGGFLLLDERLLGSGFQLAAGGGRISLQGAAADGELTGFREAVEFGPSAPDRSWGRVETSVGADFAPLSSVTLGAPNAPPQIGPVVVNEIQYHPTPDAHEFIELRNISDQSASIADWGFDSGIQFRFPRGAEIPAGGYVVLLQVPGAPGAGSNDEFVASFRREFEIGAGIDVYVFTEADGSLDNAGEELLLTMPSVDDAFRFVADRIVYSDEAPWTSRADGFGPSLSRVDASEYGNDPANWRSSRLGGTPGADNVFEDATPPSPPSNLAAAFLPDGSIAFGWSPSADVDSGVSGYEIYRDGRRVGVSTVPFYRETVPWTENAAFSYQVVASNADGFLSSASNAVEVEASFVSYQYGVDRYSGAADAQIDQRYADENFGDARRLAVSGNDGESSETAASSLFRWTNIEIPPGSMVVGVSLSLNVLNPGDPYEIKPVLQAFAEDQVTWNQARDGVPWQVPGARGDEDVGVSLGVFAASRPGYAVAHLNAAGIETVRMWLDDPASNHGVILTDPGDSTDALGVESLESRTTTSRPSLTVFHSPPSQLTTGDFNLDGIVNAADIDRIHAVIRAGFADDFFDLDRNGAVDEADVDVLVHGILRTRRGDASLDGRVGFDDFLRLAAAFAAPEPQRWDTGDFDGNGRVTFGDFVILAANYQA